jgi:L-aminopeptidase/D-esterase-like protein
MLQQQDPAVLTREMRDARFDRTIATAIAEEKKLTRAEISRMTQRYRERMLKYRAEVIARSEALPAVHAAAEESVRQAVSSGVFNAKDVQRTWKSAKDDRVRDPAIGAKTSHRSMHNQVRGFDQEFESGAGNLLRYPGDPNAPAVDRVQCRCVVATRISL